MATTTALSPAKCKAFLAKIKEHIIDAADAEPSSSSSSNGGGGVSSSSPSSSSSWKRALHCRALLAMEMLQRGVLLMDNGASAVFIESPTSASSDKAAADAAKKSTVLILNAIADCAGKTLVKESSSTPSLPKPLLAGSAAMAGRVAQIIAAASTINSTSLHDDNDGEKFVDWNLLESTRQRCLQVQDDRFLVLLSLLFPTKISQGFGGDNNNNNNNNNEVSRSEQQTIIIEQSISFLAVAEGYFYRAASFQPDAPPTWKRAWDVVVERNQLLQHQQHATTTTLTTTTGSCWDAIPALTQLRRIALAKNNASRATELALVLVSSYLDCPPPPPPTTEESNNNNNKNKSLLHKTLQAFVRPIIVSMKLDQLQQQEPSASRRPNAIRQAAQILLAEVGQQQQDNDGDDDDCNILLTLCLKVQVALNMEQDVFIQERALQLHQAALHRRDMAAAAATNTKKGNNNKGGGGGGGSNKATAAAAAAAPVLTLEAAREKALREYAWKTATIIMTDSSNANSSSSSSNNNNDDFDFDSADYQVVAGLKASAVALRDALLKEETTRKEDENSKIQQQEQEHKSLAFSMLDWYLQSQKQQTRALALVYQQKLLAKKTTANSATATTFKMVVDEAWMSIRNFVEPILQSYNSTLSLLPQAETGKDKRDVWLSFTESERKLIQTCALLVPCTFWMLSADCNIGDAAGGGGGSDTNTTQHVDMLPAAYHILRSLHQTATSQWNDAKALAEPIFSGTSSTNSSLLAQQAVTLTCALVSTRCWLEFFGVPPPLESESFNILETLAKLQHATVTSSGGGGGKTVKKDTPRQEHDQDQSMTQSSAEYGTYFLTCLISWAGLYQDAWKSCSTLPEVRKLVQCARQTLDMATSTWGRQRQQQQQNTTTLSMEDMLLDLAQADAESSFGTDGGGFSATLAQRIYHQVLDVTTSQNNKSTSSSSSLSLQLVQAHCYSGLAKLLVSTFGTRDVATSKSSSATAADPYERLHRAEAWSRQALDILKSLSTQQNGPLYFWKSQEAGSSGVNDGNDKNPQSTMIFAVAVRFQHSTARQWTAQAILLQKGRTLEALEILQAAVREAPQDATAAFTLGALQLRQALFPSLEGTTGSTITPSASASQLKAAQVQLLKAAKLDSTKANPFALLGYWYETNGDNKRAVGCYSKALVLDPTQGVAGRGLLRLTSTTTTDTVKTATLEKSMGAVTGGASPLNGWAWQETGIQKSKLYGQDELAVVALLRAARARDIAQPQSEPLSIFFAPPPSQSACRQEEKFPDLIIVLTELAACYRRLGRYTAAIRTYHLAIDSAGENVSSDLLSACGHVELELGLFDESAEKFALAVEKSKMTSTSISVVAAYGFGQALLAMAQQDLNEGKTGAALQHVLIAIGGCESSRSTSCCMFKLIGDLHSFSASLPTKVFQHGGSGSGSGDAGEGDEDCVLKCHIEFVARGEAAYLQAKEAVVAPNEEEKSLLCGSFLCDCASNILLQAKLLAQWHGVGTDSAVKPLPSAVVDIFTRATDKFRQAIQLSPLYAPAWCGLGCALLSANKDDGDTMMLAQHAFCRAIQLDPMFADAYANLSLIYTTKHAFTFSEAVSDALTQVADSPMMWINRALILERRAAIHQLSNSNSVNDQAKEFTQQASDAYRAAVQVVKPPSVVLGLAATGRIAPEVPDWDYKAYCTEYQAVSTGSSLDKDLIKIICSPGEDRSNEEINTPVVNDAGPISIAEQAVLTNRGELWLKLARELVVSSNNDKNEEQPGEALSAATAATRAASMFMLQLTDPALSLGSGHRAARVVSAQDISEALMLVHWLDSSLPKQDVMVDDSDSVQHASLRPSVDLQRALLMNPQNRLTREAIRQSQ